MKDRINHHLFITFRAHFPYPVLPAFKCGHIRLTGDSKTYLIDFHFLWFGVGIYVVDIPFRG